MVCCALGMLELKNHWRYLDFFNCATFSEGVECVFGCTGKSFRVDGDDLKHIPMKGLGSKPLRIHLEFAKEI